ncbi:MAG: TIGR03118 family protein [Betaproteobacteria bacterium]
MNLIRTLAGPLLPVLILASSLVAAPAFAANTNNYEAHTLVSDGGVPADNRDSNLKNGWGVAFNPNGFVWVADNHAGVATLYDGFGKPSPQPTPLVVTIPAAPGQAQGSPTGIVFNGSADFVVANGGKSGPSRFIFASEDGVISGWAPNVDFTNAIPVPSATTADAVYKGLALAANGTANMLYAADFHGGKIDVFNASFAPTSVPGGFRDRGIPADFAPFNIMNIGGYLYVAFAKREAGGDDEVAGQGLGFVDVFDPNGNLINRVATRGKLNAPWGMAMAPAGFGKFSGRLLVGNFGDGTINAYDVATGEFRGQLRTPEHRVLKIDGLWGLAFGNGLFNQPTNSLFFAAGPNGEENGAYGRIVAVPPRGKQDDGDGGDDD